MPLRDFNNVDLTAIDKQLYDDQHTELGKAFIQGGRNLRSSLHGTAGAVAGFAGFSDAAEEQAAQAQQLSELAARDAPQISQLSDVNDVGSAAQFAANSVVSQLPNIAQLLITGKVGRVLGRSAERKLVGSAAKRAVPGNAVAPKRAVLGDRGARLGTAAGTLAGGASLEVGSIFPDLLSDPEARKNYSTRELVGQSLAGGIAAGGLEALPVFRVFDKFGLGKAGRNAIKKSLPRRVLEEAGKGALAEGATEGLQTIIERSTHKFANENFDVFGEEGINDILNSIATGAIVGGSLSGVGGLPDPSNSFQSRLDDLEASDELNSTRARQHAQQLRQQAPELGPELDAIDLNSPDALDQVEKISFSRNLGGARKTSTRIAAGHAKSLIADFSSFEQEVVPELQRLALGEIDLTPEIRQALDDNFDNPGELLDRLAEQAGVRGGFQLADIERGLADGTLEPTPELQDKVRKLAGNKIADDMFSSEPSVSEEDDKLAGEEDVDRDAIGVKEGEAPRTVLKDDNKVLPFLTSQASRKIAGNESLDDNSQVRRLKELNEGVLGQDGLESLRREADKLRQSAEAHSAKDPVKALRLYKRALAIQNNLPYTLRPYSEAFLERVQPGAQTDVNELYLQEANRLLAANPNTQALFDSANPKAYLDQFETISLNNASQVERTVEPTDFGNEDVKSLLKKRSKPGQKLPRGDFQVSVDGKIHNVNSHDMVKKILDARGNYTPTRKDIASAFFEGIASLLQSSKQKIRLESEGFDDNLAIFTPHKGERPVKYRSIKNLGAKSVQNAVDAVQAALDNARSDAAKAELSKLLTDLRRVLKDVRRSETSRSNRSRPSNRKNVLSDIEEGKRLQKEQRREEKNAKQRATLGQGEESGAAGVTATVSGPPQRRAAAAEFLSGVQYLNEKSPTFRKDVVALAVGLGLPVNIRSVGEAFDTAKAILGITSAPYKEDTSGSKGPKPITLEEYNDREHKKMKILLEALRFSKKIHPSEDVDQSTKDLEALDALLLEELKARENPKTLEGYKGTAMKWLKELGIDADLQILSVDEAIKILKKQGIPSTEITSGNIVAFHNVINGKDVIFIHPELSPAAAIENLGHEVGHIIFRKTFGEVSAKHESAIKAAFETWRKQFGRTATLKDVVVAKKPLATIAHIMENADHALTLKEITKEDREYLLDFEEWFADNVAKWLVSETKPVSAVEHFFAHIADLIKELYRNIQGNRPDAAVKDFLDAMLARNTTHGTVGIDLDVNEATKIAKDVIDKVLGLTVRVGKETKYVRKDSAPVVGVRFMQLAANIQANVFDELANQSVRAAFDYMFSPLEKGIVGRIFTNSVAASRLRKLLADDPVALREIAINPEAAAAYGYQFWVAGELSLGTEGKSLFQRVFNWVRDVLGIISQSRQAEQIFTALRNGVLKQRVQATRRGNEFIVERRVSRTRLQKAARVGEKIIESVYPFLGKVFFTADGQMRATGNAWLIKLAEQFHAKVGTENVGETMFEARIRWIGRFSDRLKNIFEEAATDAAFGQRVVSLLNSKGESADARERAAVGKVRALLREIKDYMQENGVNVRDLGADYFPRVYSTDALIKNHDEFIKAIAQAKYDKHLIEEGEKAPQQKRIEAAERIFQSIVANDGLGDVELNPALTAHTPYFGSINERTLGWIEAQDIAPFLSGEIGNIMTTYITQAVKRAEYVQRFGEKGYGIDAFLDKAERSGASDADIANARRYVEAMMGTLGADIDPRWHKFQGAVMVYQNIRLLALATLTSLVDPIGIAVRGDLGSAWAAFQAGVDEIRAKTKGDKTELRSLAEALGTIELHMTNEALGWEYGGHHITGFARRANETFFGLNQLQRWTRVTRLVGLAGAKVFLEKHGTGEYNRHSLRFLRQLNLTPADITLEDGKLKLLSHEQRKALQNSTIPSEHAEYQRDERVRAALNRWVNEAILRPDAAQRPIWASDPHWMLVFHLKAFVYAFHDRILKRVYNEALEGNATPLVTLGAYVPVMIGADALRAVIQGLLDGDDADDPRAGWDIWDHAWSGTQRSGLTGLGQFAIDAAQDIEYGDTGLESLAGPTLQQAKDLVKLFGENGDEKAWKRFVQALPANSVYARWDTSFLQPAQLSR